MVSLNENIRTLRKKMQWTQDDFAQKLGIKRSLVGAYEEGRAEPRAELLQKMALLFGVTMELLIGADLTKGEVKPRASHQRGNEVVVVTVDTNRRENIEFVPVKASAGYLSGYADPEYVKDLPKFNLPMLKQGTYRAFEIKGDSMLPLMPGSIVVGEYVDRLNDIKSGKTYILVTQHEGIVYKRVFNYLDENGKLFLVSDNRQYAPYQLAGEDILEAWSAKAYISVQFPEVEDKSEASVEQLASVVLDLQKELFQLKSDKQKKP
ncbi:MAG: transcriptional regulator [Cytophagales bacterium]|jgi:transcriptional regulator with XRE-family HTH domain|nr:LexA family transcriptional regulator [Bacteroidota bacterium]MBS1980128.1 LexA family transcriptional regulator [Bacteroidota bacterium]WHZ08637.1 MAG: transcriptional regulator [Cytophagales bacterium]